MIMPPTPKQELDALNKKMTRVSIIEAPGIIALAIGLAAKLSDDPGGLHSLLGDPRVSTGLLVFGGAIVAWSTVQVITIVRRRSKLQKELRN